jgi:hypothetical protein
MEALWFSTPSTCSHRKVFARCMIARAESWRRVALIIGKCGNIFASVVAWQHCFFRVFDLFPAAFLSSRMSSGFVIKCCVLLAHRLDQAVDGDAPPPSLPSPSPSSPPASDDQHAAPPHASIAPREPAAILRHFTTVFQPLLSRVVWEQLDEDEFTILPRSQTISVNAKPQTPFETHIIPHTILSSCTSSHPPTKHLHSTTSRRRPSDCPVALS